MSLKNFNRALLLKLLPVGVIVAVWLGLVVTNVELGTRLLSWDLMDSSFNPMLNVWRALFGTWQEFQGVGLLGGHGYQAQLPHALLTLLLSLFIPQNYLRYTFAFGMALSGALGCYFLIRYMTRRMHDAFLVKAGALLGSLTYLLHYATIQTFYVHLEPFVAMFGLLPWVLLSLFSTLENPSHKKWFIFFLLNFGLSVIGFIPPIYVSYVIFLAIALLVFLIQKHSKESFSRAVMVVLIVFAANAYWLLPLAYYTQTNQNVYLESKLNQYSTEEFIIKNQEYGNLSNVGLMNSFYGASYDQARFNTGVALEPILLPWIKHFENPLVKFIGYTIMATGVIGLLLGSTRIFIRKETELSVSIMGILTLSWLATGVPILKFSSALFRLVPFLNQAFRIPFSKLSMSMSLFLSIGLALVFIYGISTLIKSLSLRNLKFSKFITFFLALIFIAGLSFYSLPSFQGNFFYKGARVKMPDAYNEAFAFLRSQPSTSRIIPLPMLTFSGWDMHDWGNSRGYTGSGFWWYAVPQPILHRSFDVWSGYNETFYQQTATAIYGENSAEFSQVMNKYDAQFILVDESIYLPEKEKEIFGLSQIRKILSDIDAQQVFQKDFLTIYKVGRDQAPAIATHLNSSKSRREPEALKQHSYIEKPPAESVAIFPFSHLDQEKALSTSTQENSIETSSEVLLSPGNYEVTIPPTVTTKEYDVYAQFKYEGIKLSISFPVQSNVIVGDEKIELPSLEPIVASSSAVFSKLGVIIGNKYVELQNNGLEINELISLKVGEALTVETFDASQLRSDEEGLNINPEDISLASSSAEIWQPLINAHTETIEIDQPKEIALSIQSLALPLNLNNTFSYTCDLSTGSKGQKTMLGSSTVYSSSNKTSYCESFFLDKLSFQQSYLFELKGKNELGRSLKFYLQNIRTKRADLEDILPKGEFTQKYIVLDWPLINPYEGNNGYVLHLEDRSFGSQKTLNTLNSITFWPYPLKQLSQIQVRPLVKVETDFQPIKVTSTQKFGTFFYKFEVENTNPVEDQILTLPQGFDRGWIALTTPRQILKDHMRVNGWANGWILTPGKYQIVIIYWPQLLSFFGFGILILTLVTFIYFLARSSYAPRKNLTLV